MSAKNLQKAYNAVLEHRDFAELTVRRRENEIIKKIPGAGDLLRCIEQAGPLVAKVILAKQEDAAAQIEKIMRENLAAQSKLTELLIQYRYPSDYLEVPYSCKKCNDTGYRNGIRCECVNQLAVSYDAKEFSDTYLSHLAPKGFDGFSLDYYSTRRSDKSSTQREIMQQILVFCKEYADRFSRHAPSVLMMGNTGLGKTHLSLAIADAIMKKNFSVTYVSAPELFRRLQSEYYGKGGQDENTMDTLLYTDLVILDDLGAEIDNQFNVSALYDIINSRLIADRPMIINTNYTPKELEARYTNRTASRLMTMYKCLKFVGTDVREQKLRKKEH